MEKKTPFSLGDLWKSVRERLATSPLLENIKFQETKNPTQDWPFPERVVKSGWSLAKLTDVEVSLNDDIQKIIAANDDKYYLTTDMSTFLSRYDILRRQAQT